MYHSTTKTLGVAAALIALLFLFKYQQRQSNLETMQEVELLDVRVDIGESENRISTGVFGTVLNQSQDDIKVLEITVDYLGEEDEVLDSARFFPVYHLSFSNPGILKPKEAREFGFDLEPTAPQGWAGEVHARITNVQFRP
jgi:hypothetical protein